MKEFNNSDILTLYGSPQQRGRIHGETFRIKIRELMDRWKAWLALSVDEPIDQYIQELVGETNFVDAIRQWTPGLLDEVTGIAEGANVSGNELFAFQLLDEEWWFGQEKKQERQSPTLNCSSIGWNGTPTIIAQNMDLPDYLDGFQVVFRIIEPQSDVVSLVFSTVGLIALNGINNYSIGIVCNNLGQLNHSRAGLPVAYVHRGVLEKKGFLDAKAFLEAVPHASGQNYILGGVGQVIDLECSANQVATYGQPERNNRICHTNHPFVNTDYRRTTQGDQSSQEDLSILSGSPDDNSHTRFNAVYLHMGEIENENASTDTAKRLLQAHDSNKYPVCRHSQPGSPWMTVGTSIMELGVNPQLQVCPGPPCSSTFTTINFPDKS